MPCIETSWLAREIPFHRPELIRNVIYVELIRSTSEASFKEDIV